MNNFIYAAFLFTLIALGLNITDKTAHIIDQMVFAQTNQTRSTDVTNATRNSLLTSLSSTFYAVGTISSLNFDNNSVSDIATSNKVVLSGDWDIDVNKGRVSFFEADFVASPDDGGFSHMHELVNLKVKDAKPIQLTSNGSTSIIGTVDVKLNGINYWNDVRTSILISKGSTITIILDDVGTQHHFTKQPIYGLVNRLIY